MKCLEQLSCLIALSLWLIGCAQERTYLSEEIKSINPYQQGQKLIFMSDMGTESSLLITGVQDGQFPDGIGAFYNERMIVKAYRQSRSARDGTEERILTFLGETDKEKEQIDFSISLKECALVMKAVPLSEYLNRLELHIDTSFESYDDVLIYEKPVNPRMYDRAVIEFWWSKSKGYVRLVQKNGTIWDLKSIE